MSPGIKSFALYAVGILMLALALILNEVPHTPLNVLLVGVFMVVPWAILTTVIWHIQLDRAANRAAQAPDQTP